MTDTLAQAVLAGADGEQLEREPVPARYTAAHLRAEDIGVFDGVADKDVRRTLRVSDVPMPELAPDEVLVAVMASSINYNTVWSATFEPMPTFDFLTRYGRQGGWAGRHDQPYHVLGSDAAGVIVRTGSGVRRWQTGDHVVVSCTHVDDQEPATHADGMLGADQRIWGFETNFGGLAHYTVARASQLLPKAAHLTWEEAASVPLCAGTSYRMLVGEHGARMKQGDIVLIWGATGGLGAFAVQLVKNGGGIPVGVVSSEAKADVLRRLGCDVIINRAELGMAGDGHPDPGQAIELGKRIGRIIRREVGEDPHIAFDFIGQATFATSVFLVRRGGTVVTCGSSTGYQHTYDNRYLWMNLKRIIGSHSANFQEAWECNRLVQQGRLMPALSEVHTLADVGEASRRVQQNRHIGKVGVLCLAPEAGLGVTDPETRARIGGDERINPLRLPAGDVSVPALAH
ncbi:crotonyl-CoA reductase [Streptomyces sp. DvalAA-14]|uniref:crotonyl-CoA carboxylase/reductase n=1 Tax=unclassified Streptomyces TaxID=2593676 RepID=UPI00081B1CD2|nr:MULTISPECIES: crotonyl-CoA carboxylase/reductase [unclassified Streptomyces]MYS24427.1 crotonyl-CoA carboxylase/reductase [Streptomyces sp. SID4948]SCE45906.1 crotonyl-CoA reductase [Streptomyces sp. DvalAA-14]